MTPPLSFSVIRFGEDFGQRFDVTINSAMFVTSQLSPSPNSTPNSTSPPSRSKRTAVQVKMTIPPSPEIECPNAQFVCNGNNPYDSTTSLASRLQRESTPISIISPEKADQMIEADGMNPFCRRPNLRRWLIMSTQSSSNGGQYSTRCGLIDHGQ
mmetsp:Transcript_7482/g.13463  ORF Transcript_7482/g.13463 Transcript_7482/m.13463 type:complete len:155 (-) Transcript_7482:322-786(-)